ncbi:MAG: N-acetyltransferase [Thermoanaerobaculia bacterium]|nr:N-acetyltransferase [Thermoanaerobaculia bacterium]
MAEGLSVLEVSSRRDLAEFVELPYRLFASEPDWVPPLRSDVRWMLDPARNPFWNHARRSLLLARRGGRVVGRVAAIADDAHNRIHADRTAFFGFFECENDPEAAKALFDAAEAAARRLLPGCDRLRGPVNPSMNDEVGFLLAGESEPGPPVLMMTWNPAYYLELAAAAGFSKEKDLVALIAPIDDRSFARLGRITDAVRRRNPELTFRTIRMDRFPEELAKVKEVYNAAWERNWGFVPMTSEEIDAMAKKLKDLLYPPIVWFVEAGEKPVAFMLGMPDFNQVLIRMGGRLLPFGWLRFLLGRKKVDRVRLMAFGVLPEYRRKGLDAVCYFEGYKAAMAAGFRTVEFSWILEDNLDLLKPIEVFEGRLYRRYRLVARTVPSAS